MNAWAKSLGLTWDQAITLLGALYPLGFTLSLGPGECRLEIDITKLTVWHIRTTFDQLRK